jgi:signal transduction histidine kinase
MRRRTLQGRLNTVLLQWFALSAVAAGVILALSVPGFQRRLTDDRLLLATTIAHSLDGTISSSIQNLGRLASDLSPETADLAGRLRVFRFHSPFGSASYILDGTGRIVAADPATVEPLPADGLGSREAVTPLVRKAGAQQRPVLAIVQPLQREWADHFLVSEMDPVDSRISAFLQDLGPDLDMHVAIVDENGVVVAARESRDLFRSMSEAAAYADRIRAHRSLVIDDVPCEFDLPGQSPVEALTVMVPLRFAPWAVVIQQHRAAALSGLYRTRLWLLMAGALLAGMTWLLSRTLSSSVVSPIRRLSEQAATIRGGNLSNPVSVTGDVEIEVLANTLDEARVRLASTLDELQVLNDNLEAKVETRTKVIAVKDQQRQVLVRRLLSATEEERRRLARELHDEISQLLTVIQLSLDRVNVDSAEMARARSLLSRTQDEIHRIIYALRPSLLDDLGLSAAIESYAEEHLSRAGLNVSLEIEENLRARPAIEIPIFRIYQELMTNILRHAEAEHVSIELYEHDRKLILAVEDDGKGFDPDAQSSGVGLSGMRERAALVNASIRFDSEPGQGTHVVVEIPLP